MTVHYLDIFFRNEKAKNFVVLLEIVSPNSILFDLRIECERAQMLQMEIAQARQKVNFDGNNGF